MKKYFTAKIVKLAYVVDLRHQELVDVVQEKVSTGVVNCPFKRVTLLLEK